MSLPLKEIVETLESLLSHDAIGDYGGAQNGLHLENSGSIESIATAVDANVLTLREAALERSRLLIVHHGLAWNGLCPLTGNTYEMIRSAIQADLAVFSSHLPLDAHDRFGNNVLLAHKMGFQESIPFLEVKGTLLARLIAEPLPLSELSDRLRKAVGQSQIIPGGPAITRKILISTGSGNSLLEECATRDIDTLVTGEVSHDAFSRAYELGINLLLGGHYATETLGVQAIGRFVSEKFNLPLAFIDHPSGL